MTDPYHSLSIDPWLEIPWTDTLKANWPAHVMLYGLAKFLRARNTLEIGIGQQALGTYMLGTHAKEVDGKHTGIDVSPTCINRAMQIVDKFDLPVMILHGDSKAIVWQGWLDLIYIDGGHSTEQVLGDIENYARWVKTGGMIIFDDYFKKHLGVTQAIDAAFDPDVWDMMAIPRAWWALWRKK